MSYDDAIKSPENQMWRKAIQSELDSLEQNNTSVMTKLPDNANVIGCRWVFTKKLNKDGSIARYKARLVAKGFSQRPEVDFDETYAPVISLTSVRTILAYATRSKMIIKHFDVCTAFLYGTIHKTIYMRPPRGFKCNDDEVCQLKRSIYGLKQSPRC